MIWLERITLTGIALTVVATVVLCWPDKPRARTPEQTAQEWIDRGMARHGKGIE